MRTFDSTPQDIHIKDVHASTEPRSFSRMLVTGGAGFIGANFVHIQNYSTKKLHDREAMEKKEYVSNQFRMSDLMGSLTV